MKKFRKSKGFTLMETLMVVAIVVILAGIGFVEVAKYQKKLVQLERDNAAKELFIAAQNHLSMAEGQGYLLRNDDGEEEKADNQGTGIYWYVVGTDGTDPDESDSFLNLMLPFGAIDETIRSGGSYIIRYQKYPALVLDVFYSAPSERWGHSFAASEYSGLMSGYTGDEHKADRRDYDGSIIGYYGGTGDEDGSSIQTGDRLDAPTVRLYNGDKLYATVTNPNLQDYASLTLIITGETSGNQAAVQLTAETLPYVTKTTDGSMYTVILDDITGKLNDLKDSKYTGMNFKNLYCSGDDALIPGEDITLEAVAFSNSVFTNIAESAEVTGNSLFASVTETTEDGKTVITAGISSFRHLENLCQRVSSISAGTVTAAEQLGDLVWEKNGEVFNKNSKIYLSNDQRATSTGYFQPVNPANALDYNGNGYAIQGAKFKIQSHAGVFGKLLEGSSVSDLEIISVSVNSSGEKGYAGGLVGYADKTEISNVLVRNDNTTEDENIIIQGANCTGGLVGYMHKGSIKNCAASVYVYGRGGSATENGVTTTFEGYAGGLVGKINGTEIYGCYAGGHTVNARFTEYTTSLSGNNEKGHINVQSANASAGGLIGYASGSYSINCSYATVSCRASNYAGGLLGYVEGKGSIRKSYTASMLVSETNTNKDKIGYFIGKKDSSSTINCSDCYYVIGISENVRENDTYTGVKGVYGTATDCPVIIQDDDKKASSVTYDETLVIEYEGKFSFQTVAQLSEGKYSEAGITDIHVGDWQIPTLGSLPYAVFNSDTLKVRINPDPDDDEVTFAIKGKTSGNVRMLVIKIKSRTANEFELEKQVYIKNGESTENEITITDKTPSYISYNANAGYIDITLDDITSAEQHHFYELFCTGEGALIPGETIEVRACSSDASWGKVQGVQSVETNGLFGTGSTYTQAKIYYVRHLQNLDQTISKVTEGAETRVTGAKLERNITWDGEKYKNIYAAGTSKNISDSFYGICNSNLRIFDGGNYTLTGFVINAAPKEINTNGNGNAGLFRIVKYDLSISNLMLKDFSVTGASVNGNNSTGSAGTLVGQCKGATLTVDSVMAVSQNCVVTSNTKAGGLIGRVDGGANVVINNSAASMRVSSSTDSGDAGGLVGIEADSGSRLTITNSYVGGHTDGNKIYSTTANEYNIRGYYAGGIVGRAHQGALKIENSFSTASVYGKRYGGGVLGCVDEYVGAYSASGSGVYIENVYTTAPVCNISSVKNNRGAFIGGQVANKNTNLKDQIAVSNCYYLPEVYSKGKVKDVNAGTSNIQATGTSVTLTSGTIKAFSYTMEGLGEALSAKAHSAYMASRTYPYDSAIKADGTEYPFLIYTTSSFEKTAQKNSKIFYGDWQVQKSTQTVQHDVVFQYIEPGNAENSTPVSITNNTLANQKINEGEENQLVVPVIDESADKFFGYEIDHWIIKDTTTKAVLTNNAKQDETTGLLVIDAEYTTGDITAIAVYAKNDDVCTVRFKYDPSGNNVVTDATMIGSAIEVGYGSALSQITAPTAPAIEGYSFIGWYDGNDNPIDFESETLVTVTSDLIVYAHYLRDEYYSIKIDFAYRIKGDNTSIYTVPGRKPIEIEVHKGEAFNQTISLTTQATGVAAGYGNPKACQVKTGPSDSISNSGSTITINISKADSSSYSVFSYVVIYEVEEGNSQIQYYNYKVIYILENTESSNYGQSYSASEKFYYDRYGETKKAPVGSLPVVALEDTIGTRSEKSSDDQTTFFRGEASAFTRETDNIQLVSGEGSGSTRYVYITYSRKRFTLSFANTGDRSITPERLYYGQSIGNLSDRYTPTKKGYTFDGTWSFYESREAVTALSSQPETMPMKNLVAKPGWISGQSQYTVQFWYQNADPNSDGTYNYSYKGSITQTAATGSTVYSDAWADIYSKDTHTHTLDCYEGAEGSALQTGSKEIKNGCGKTKVTYHIYGGEPISITDKDKNNLSNGYVSSWTYYEGYSTKTGSGKCMYYNGGWYIYTGTVAAGQTVPCTKDIKVIEGATWIDNQNFKYNNNCGFTTTETVLADGSTVLNVYYERKSYTLVFKVDDKVVKRITAKYYANINDQFPITTYNTDGTVKATYQYQWIFETDNSMYSSSSKYFIEIDRMPCPTDKDLTEMVVNNNTSLNGNDRCFYYYLEVTEAEQKDSGVIARTIKGEEQARYYKLYSTSYNGLSSNWSLTYAEDFYEIDGFEQCGLYYSNDRPSTSDDILYAVNDSTKFNSDCDDGCDDDVDTTFRNYMEFYYTRDTYQVHAKVEGSEVSGSPITVQYGASLKDVVALGNSIASPKPADKEHYEFTGFCYDSACTDANKVLSTDLMPLGDIIVYGKWNPVKYTVTFYWTEGGQIFTTLKCAYDNNLSPMITDDNGNLKADYKLSSSSSGAPSSISGKTFEGWYYRDGSGTEQEYIPEQAITSNLSVYAKWKDAASEQEDLTRTVVLYHYKNVTGTDGKITEVLYSTDSTTYSGTVGNPITLRAIDIEGFKPQEIEKVYYVTSDEDQSYSLYYDEIDPWEYTVEYYVELKALTGTTLSGYTLETEAKDYLISTSSPQTADTQSAKVTLSVPTGYEKYKIDHYVYNSKTGYSSSLKISEALGTTIKCYLVPDFSENTLGQNSTCMYDGTVKTNSTDIKYEDLSKTWPDVYKVEARSICTYANAAGGALGTGEGKDAGLYQKNVYVVMQVTETEGATPKNFLVWKNTDLTLTITKRNVVITSKSVSKAYTGNMVTCEQYDITGDGFAPDTDEGVVVTFTKEEAYRVEPGTATNSFEYTLKSGTDANNYLIKKVYGTLEVYWKYRVDYYVALYNPQGTKYPVGYTLANDLNIRISSGTVTEEDSSITASVTVSIPESYSRIKFKSAECIVDSGGENRAVYDEEASTIVVQFPPKVATEAEQEPVSVLNIYLEPDVDADNITYTIPNLTSEGDLVFISDRVGAAETITATNGKTYNAEVFYVYDYYSDKTRTSAITEETELTAGSYYVYANAYVMLRVNEVQTSETGEEPEYSWYVLAYSVDNPNLRKWITVA